MGRIQLFPLYDAYTKPGDFLSKIQAAFQNAEPLNPQKHLLNLPADRSFELALEKLEYVVTEIIRQREYNPQAGQRADKLGIQLVTLYEILSDNLDLNPHVQTFSRMLNNELLGSLEEQSRKILDRIVELKRFISTFPLRDST